MAPEVIGALVALLVAAPCGIEGHAWTVVLEVVEPGRAEVERVRAWSGRAPICLRDGRMVVELSTAEARRWFGARVRMRCTDGAGGVEGAAAYHAEVKDGAWVPPAWRGVVRRVRFEDDPLWLDTAVSDADLVEGCAYPAPPLPARVPGFTAGPLGDAGGGGAVRRTYARGKARITVTWARFPMTDADYARWVEESAAYPQANLPTDANGFYQCTGDRCALLVQLRTGIHLELRGEGPVPRATLTTLATHLIATP